MRLQAMRSKKHRKGCSFIKRVMDVGYQLEKVSLEIDAQTVKSILNMRKEIGFNNLTFVYQMVYKRY